VRDVSCFPQECSTWNNFGSCLPEQEMFHVEPCCEARTLLSAKTYNVTLRRLSQAATLRCGREHPARAIQRLHKECSTWNISGLLTGGGSLAAPASAAYRAFPRTRVSAPHEARAQESVYKFRILGCGGKYATLATDLSCFLSIYYGHSGRGGLFSIVGVTNVRRSLQKRGFGNAIVPRRRFFSCSSDILVRALCQGMPPKDCFNRA
jgi:hypothetical protein